jgi:thiosulfate dehydrogenase [quinone] large subunit
MKKLSALLFLRIGLGINMLMHGLVRIPHLEVFASKMSEDFENTFLPTGIAKCFLYILPFLETSTGILILIGGKWTRNGLVLGVILLCMLMFGTTLKQDWNTAGTQLIYIIAFAYGLNLYDQETERKKKADIEISETED